MQNIEAGEEQRKSGTADKPRGKIRRRALWIGLTLLTALLIAFGVAIRVLDTNYFQSSTFLKGHVSDLLSQQPLQTDQNGMTTILVFANSDDDGEWHENKLFVDSLFLLSIGQNGENAKVLPVPRDIIVNDYEQCDYEFVVKLKVIYQCGLQKMEPHTFESAAKFLQSAVEKVTGVKTQYYIKLNFGALKTLIDKVGGISLTPYTDDPRGISDTATGVHLPPHKEVHLDGEQSIALARARGYVEDGSYGLSGGEIDRSTNQDLIFQALFKALKSYSFNIGDYLDMVNQLNQNLYSDLQVKEARSFVKTLRSVSNFEFVNILEADPPVLQIVTLLDTTHASEPLKGHYKFEDLHQWYQNELG